MTNIVFQTASELALRIAKKLVSAESVLDAHLEHIARHNPALNAIVMLDTVFPLT
jgi:amidase